MDCTARKLLLAEREGKPALGERGLFYKLHNFDLFHHGALSGLNL